MSRINLKIQIIGTDYKESVKNNRGTPSGEMTGKIAKKIDTRHTTIRIKNNIERSFIYEKLKNCE